MTIERVTNQEPRTPEKPPVTVQNDVNKDIQKEATTATGATSSQKQLLALLGTIVPQQQIEETSKSQLKEEGIDIRV